ncbi:hypothetical protein N9A89_04950 [Akkermansiaceae bacterium]|nr:hypothetical protein [Akkermansiaceae bacterium]MDB4276768.1 hypothetical protein [bacterium]MDA7537649.1 hypothetical protein [Akkermansiaceae bacterium]MDA7651165.1 hypothetical protein [Akkermansiaceae bacterium]MDA7675236.1 hypothetical protein [Akkermansiaceae bacterium]
MIKTIKKIGNSKGIILDAALLDLAHLSEGDQLSVTVHDGGTISFTPIKTRTVDDETFTDSLNSVLSDYSETLEKLS